MTLDPARVLRALSLTVVPIGSGRFRAQQYARARVVGDDVLFDGIRIAN